MGQISNSIYMSSIDDGASIHGSLRATRSLTQCYDSASGSFAPDWKIAANQPVIYLTLLNGNVPAVPNGWSAQDQDAVTWRHNGNIIHWDSNNHSTQNDMYDNSPLFERTTASWKYDGVYEISVPALKIIGNMAVIGNLDNDVISIEGGVEMAGAEIPFTANITVQLGAMGANGYVGAINFPDGSYIPNDESSIRAIGKLYTSGGEVESYRCKWQFNGNDVTSTTATDSVYLSTTDKYHDTLHVSGNDDTGVLDIATVMCTFYVPDDNGEAWSDTDTTKWSAVYTCIETIDDTGDEEYMYVYYTISGVTGVNNGSPIALRKDQVVSWDVVVGKASDPDTHLSFAKYEFQPRNAEGTKLTNSAFTSDSNKLNNAANWENGWCNIGENVSENGSSIKHGRFSVCYADIKNAGKNISGIIRAIKTSE